MKTRRLFTFILLTVLTLFLGLALSRTAWTSGVTSLQAANTSGRRVLAANQLTMATPMPGTWSLTGRLHDARERHTATLLNDGRVLVAGGYGGGPHGSGTNLASAELYSRGLMPMLHMASIEPGYQPLGSHYQVSTTVAIEAAHGAPVAGATLLLSVTRPDGTARQYRFLTNDNGQARFGFISAQTGSYEFCVDDVSKLGWIYDPTQNVELCDSVTIP